MRYQNRIRGGVCKNKMWIHDTDESDRLYRNLVEYLDESTKGDDLEASKLVSDS